MIQKVQMGDTVKIKNYYSILNGKNATLLSIDGGYYLVKCGLRVVEIYGCEFDFVKRTKKGRELAIQWNIKNMEERIVELGKDISRARRDLKKYKGILNKY